jgi:hypothetical protein
MGSQKLDTIESTTRICCALRAETRPPSRAILHDRVARNRHLAGALSARGADGDEELSAAHAVKDSRWQ